MDEFRGTNNNDFEDVPVRRVSNVATGTGLVKKAIQEASQQPKKIITLDKSGGSQPEAVSSGVRDIESRLKKRTAEIEGKDLESLIREQRKEKQQAKKQETDIFKRFKKSDSNHSSTNSRQPIYETVNQTAMIDLTRHKNNIRVKP